ncbi:3-oxoacyl-[acyl-carrier-protein] synthase III C-terminal domain-containing protein [Helicobacter marmotae]|uniref:Beta-ketoacyl-ACP synthase III n=1 Tax=Helicobacter marmotae TaxID=152490 RepID=A0A3D8I8A1_9HELI|nr:3-oxoacyl-[acyl-carrier-protein] synthase III C-terminal domain-containing protein [Helicobacter marmotae]RDU60761.1 beta-ketoacyl-ACP synthase III [Helicobacter marmotae]
MKATFSHTSLLATFTLVPPKVIHIDSELDTLYHGDKKALERIKKVIGLQTRHVAEPHITASDMAESASLLLLESLHFNKQDIDALIFVTQTPDYSLPASACYLHGKLGLSQACLCFDINQACAGYLYGLYIAHSLIESHAARNVLLLCGDTLSRHVNPLDSNLAPVIGDGVSASLLSFEREPRNAYFELGSDGLGFDKLIIPKSANRIPTKDIIKEPKVWEVSERRQLDQLYMDGAEIFSFAITKEPKAFKSLFEYANLSPEAIDYFFFHQANKYIVDNITRTLGLPQSKVPNTTTNKYGNLSGCSIPATICDTLALKASEGLNAPLKVHLAGFGAGLSWGNAILELKKGFITQAVSLYDDPLRDAPHVKY